MNRAAHHGAGAGRRGGQLVAPERAAGALVRTPHLGSVVDGGMAVAGNTCLVPVGTPSPLIALVLGPPSS